MERDYLEKRIQQLEERVYIASWLLAFLLLLVWIIVSILSTTVFAYEQKQKKNSRK